MCGGGCGVCVWVFGGVCVGLCVGVWGCVCFIERETRHFILKFRE